MSASPFSEWIRSATLFDWLANLSALIVILMLGLVIYGFRRYARRPRTDPIDFIGMGIWLMALDTVLRLLWGDLIPDLLPAVKDSLVQLSPNVGFVLNCIVAWACWNMLKGFFLLVEMRAPGQYTILTAVFYPKRLGLGFAIRKSKGIDE